jgi:hypothetical protein
MNKMERLGLELIRQIAIDANKDLENVYDVNDYFVAAREKLQQVINLLTDANDE